MRPVGDGSGLGMREERRVATAMFADLGVGPDAPLG